MRLRVATLVAAAGLAGAAPASAADYTVTGFGDTSPAPSCSGTSCPTLRAAVEAANANPGVDSILLPVGAYSVSAGTLVVSDDVTIAGSNTRQTTVSATPSGAPAFTVTGGADATFGLLTIGGGTNAISTFGGSTTGLSFARVTGASGAGVLNRGTVVLANSLVDGNGGAGIQSTGIDGAAAVTVGSSTIAANGGAGIVSLGSAQNSVFLLHATIARNTGAGVNLGDVAQDATATASIIANNGGGANCVGGVLEGTLNVEDTTSCALDAGQNRVVSNPLLAAAPADAGGFTNVLTIPAGSPAADYVPSCTLSLDQRGFQKPAGQPCDAGAYDRDAVDPGLGGGGDQQPPPPAPTPQPPGPTPTPTPAPVVNQTAVVRETRGTIKVQLPGSKTFVDLDATRGIPMGSRVDARKGAVEITSVPKAGAPPEKAVFYDGLFKLTQSRGITNLTLVEPLDCSKRSGRASAAQKAKKPKKRRLWGDGKGAFRITGRYSAATVRGTKWFVEDTCTSTTTRVLQGSVTVAHGKKRIVVRAGKRYVARKK